MLQDAVQWIAQGKESGRRNPGGSGRGIVCNRQRPEAEDSQRCHDETLIGASR